MRTSNKIILITAITGALVTILLRVNSTSINSDNVEQKAVKNAELRTSDATIEKMVVVRNTIEVLDNNRTNKAKDTIDQIIEMQKQGASLLSILELFSAALSADAKGTISDLAKRNYDPALYELLAPVLKDYGKQNPFDAINLMSQLESFEETRWLGAAYEGVLIKNPKLARSALDNSSEFGLYHYLDSYLKSISLSSTSPELLNQIVDVFNSAANRSVDVEPGISNALQNQIDRKAAIGIKDITDFATAFSATNLKDISLAAENLASAFAKISPEAAITWSGTLSEQVRPGALQAIVNKWAARDLDAAVEFGFSSQGTSRDQISVVAGLYDAVQGNQSHRDIEKKCAEWLSANTEWFAKKP